MFQVAIGLSQDRRYHPLTVDGPEYLYMLAQFIARSVPEAEVRARLGTQAGDEVIFRAHTGDDEIELF